MTSAKQREKIER